MKKIIIFLIAIISFAAATAQINWIPDGKFGTKTGGIAATRALFFPTGCGAPSSLSSKDSLLNQAAQYYDSCNKRFYLYDPKLKIWDSLSSSMGGSGPSFDSSLLNLNARFDLKPDYPDLKDTIQKVLDYLVLNNVSDFAGFIGFANSVVVKDTLRGDRFDIYTGPDAVDNGMIFEDALGRKWLRAINESPKINAAWYGFSPLATPSNNATYIEAARDFIYSHPNRVRILYIPPNKSIYRLSRQIKFTSAIWIEGDESTDSIGIKNATKLSWPMNTRGFFFQPYQSTFRAKLSNLNFETEFDYLPRDTTALIETRIRLDIYNVNISYASGYGIVYKAALGGDSTSNPIFGDCSYSEIHGTNINECLTAIYVEGADANHIKGFGINTQANVRYGLDDNSFLGCSWYSPSFSGNGNASLAGAATIVTYGGKWYQALPVHDTTLLGIGKRPDLNPTWWKEVTARAADVWDTTVHYWSGGPFILRHPSGTSEIYSAYREGDQPVANIYNTRSKVDGGTDGAGTWGYGLEKTVLGSRYLQYDGIKLSTGNSTNPHFYLGPNDPPHPVNLYVEQPLGQPGILLDATDYPAILEFRTNQTGATYYAKIYYGGAGRLGFSTYNTEILYLQPTEGLVPSYDNVLNFGTNTNRIKDIWALLSNGAGNKTIRWNTDGKFTLVDTTTYSAGFGLRMITGAYPNIHYEADTTEVATKLYVNHYVDSVAATVANFYNSDGVLTNHRTVDADGYNLTVDGLGQLQIVATQIKLDAPVEINGTSTLDSVYVRKYDIGADSDSAWTKGTNGKMQYAKINGGGGSGATAAQLRRFGSTDVTGTDANITAAAGNVIYLPAATLSTNRTIDVSALNTDGDYLEIYNNEAGFTWSFTGATVYLLDRTTTVTTLVVDAVYKIRKRSGKLIINN